jgi:hypothetical protein
MKGHVVDNFTVPTREVVAGGTIEIALIDPTLYAASTDEGPAGPRTGGAGVGGRLLGRHAGRVQMLVRRHPR